MALRFIKVLDFAAETRTGESEWVTQICRKKNIISFWATQNKKKS